MELHSLALDVVAAWAPLARELQDGERSVQHLVQEILKLVMKDLVYFGDHATTRLAKLHVLRAIHRNGKSIPNAG